MLKVTTSPMKISTKPTKAKVTAVPAGHTAKMQKWAEQDARAKAYREGSPQRIAEHLKRLSAANAARYAANRALREAEKRKPKRLWDNYEEIAVIQKSARLRFSIAACTRDGFRCVTIREFYLRQRDGQWMPSKDGIMIPLMAPISRTKDPDPNNPPKIIYPMHEFVLALNQAIETAQTMELSDPDNAVWLTFNDTTEESKDEDR